MLKIYGEANGFGWKHNEIVGAQVVTVPMDVPLRKAERTAAGIEAAVASRLSPAEARTLIRLLRKVYLDR